MRMPSNQVLLSRSRGGVRSSRLWLAADRGPWIEVGLITALAGVLRFATLGLQSYDFDEAFTVAAVHGSFAQMLHAVARTESTPPLYYALAWVWVRIFGADEVGLRSLSA